MTDQHAVLDSVRSIVCGSLGLGSRSAAMNASSPLLGAVPELDSMAVVNVITALEEYFDFTVADDEIDASAFATLGTLVAFVESKLAA